MPKAFNYENRWQIYKKPSCIVYCARTPIKLNADDAEAEICNYMGNLCT